MKDLFKQYINSGLSFTDLSESQAKSQHASGT